MKEYKPVKVGSYWVVRIELPEKYRKKFKPTVPKKYRHVVEDYKKHRDVVGFYTDEQKRVRPIKAKTTQAQVLKERKEEIKKRIEEAKKKPSFARSAGVPAFKKRKLEIDPLVRDKYYEWVRYSRRWRSRKMLPIGALQKYYESRKAAFVAEGGDPDVFDDAFDKLDMAQAVDSWADLDKELSKHLVFTYRKERPLSQREIEEMIREHEEEERRIEELYRHYLEEDERRREHGMG